MTNYMCSETGDASGFRGCGRWFGSLAAFDRHWSRATTPDDADRDSCIVAIDGRGCATDAELLDRGIDLCDDVVWRDVHEATRVTVARAGGAFAVRRRVSRGRAARPKGSGRAEGGSRL